MDKTVIQFFDQENMNQLTYYYPSHIPTIFFLAQKLLGYL